MGLALATIQGWHDRWECARNGSTVRFGAGPFEHLDVTNPRAFAQCNGRYWINTICRLAAVSIRAGAASHLGFSYRTPR